MIGTSVPIIPSPINVRPVTTLILRHTASASHAKGETLPCHRREAADPRGVSPPTHSNKGILTKSARAISPGSFGTHDSLQSELHRSAPTIRRIGGATLTTRTKSVSGSPANGWLKSSATRSSVTRYTRQSAVKPERPARLGGVKLLP